MNKKGFSLIEILVVIAIIGIVLGVGLASLAATIRSSTRTTISNQVKQSGDLAIETIARSVRNAVDVCTVDTVEDANAIPDLILTYSSGQNCSSPPFVSTIVLRCIEGDPSGVDVTARNGGIRKIEIDSAGITTSETPITSQVQVEPGSCRFEASSTIPKRVIISFTLMQDADLPDTPDYQVEIPFRSEVTLRNF